MAAVSMTPAQLRKLGVEVPTKKSPRTKAKGPYHTVCTTCLLEFVTAAAEDRHLADTHHARYELVLS